MIALLQRTREASVSIDGDCCAEIGHGLLVLLGVRQLDDERLADKLADRVRHYRVFGDAEGKMNLDVQQAGGEVLVVPQFTLAADTTRGRRPGFSTAASPVLAVPLFERFCQTLATGELPVKWGVFGADMQVALINDGPVTFWLESE